MQRRVRRTGWRQGARGTGDVLIGGQGQRERGEAKHSFAIKYFLKSRKHSRTGV